MKKAYSYIRFSSAMQADGNSLSRQIKLTKEYCAKHNLVLDETLSFRDLGVSAFKGDNRKKGLGQFLAACEAGLVEEGSALVVESLDRLSRQRPRVVVTLLGHLLDDYGLEVHLTSINQILKPHSASAAEEGSSLIIAVALAIRAAEEQETKSLRVREAFEKKMKAVEKGQDFWRKASSQLPWWIEFDEKTSCLQAIPERVEVLKMMYQCAADVGPGESGS
ncbi:MAG: recombinase family protein [Luteolibacter sp.]